MKTQKFSKKLELNKETVARLNNGELRAAKGGAFTFGVPTCWPECPIISVVICLESEYKPCV